MRLLLWLLKGMVYDERTGRQMVFQSLGTTRTLREWAIGLPRRPNYLPQPWMSPLSWFVGVLAPFVALKLDTLTGTPGDWMTWLYFPAILLIAAAFDSRVVPHMLAYYWAQRTAKQTPLEVFIERLETRR